MSKAPPFSGEPGAIIGFQGNLLSRQDDGSFVITRQVTLRRPMPEEELSPPRGGVTTIGRLRIEHMFSQPTLINADGDTVEEEESGSQPAIASGFVVTILPRKSKVQGLLK